MTAADWVTAVLMPVGALFSLIGIIGLVRFPTLLSRLHAATKPDTVGVILILAGAAFQLPDIRSAAPLALVALFQFVSVPTLGQTLGRVAYSRGMAAPEHLVVDELADALKDAEGAEPEQPETG